MIDLKAIREAAELSRQEHAKRLGLSSRSGRVTVAEIEAREDWLVSSVRAFVQAAGGSAEVVVTVNGQELRYTL